MRNFYRVPQYWVLVMLLASWANLAMAQLIQIPPVVVPKSPAASFNCYPVKRPNTTPTQRGANGEYVPFGYDITARGQLRVLIVYAGFTNDINNKAPSYSDGDWPQTDATHPVPGTSFPTNAGGGFYTSISQFSSSATDQTLSNFYYQMSQFSGNPLRMTRLFFPSVST